MEEASQDTSLRIKVLVRDLGRMLTDPISFTSNNHVAMSVTVLTILLGTVEHRNPRVKGRQVYQRKPRLYMVVDYQEVVHQR